MTLERDLFDVPKERVRPRPTPTAVDPALIGAERRQPARALRCPLTDYDYYVDPPQSRAIAVVALTALVAQVTFSAPPKEGEAMRRFILVALSLCALAGFGAVPASADHVAPHQHILVTPSGTMIPVGPDACVFGPSEAFDQFHFNIHFGTPNLEAFPQPNNPVSFVAPVPCP
jgi:hypothetical protein